MDFAERITYSREQMLLFLENSLEKLNAIRYDSIYRQALGEEFVERVNFWVQTIRAQKENPFTMVVVGDFKRGKSTFINALLGEEVAPTDVTTETVTLNKIFYGPHSNEAVLSGSRRVRLADEELKRETLESLILQAGEPISKIEIARENPLLKKVTILDTPGTGDSMQDFSDIVKESLLQADAVVYVFNAQYPLSMTEQMFLKSAVLPQKHTSLFLVANFADTLGNEENIARMSQLLEERCQNLLPNAKITMISALDELCRLLEEDRPSRKLKGALESRFAGLRSQIQNLVEEKADAVVLDRMQRLTSAMLQDLYAELDAMEKGLEMDESAAAEALERLAADKEECGRMQREAVEDMEKQVSRMRLEANEWLREFLGRLEKESLNLSLVPREVLLKYYEFYCIDLLQEAMNTCVEYHQERMFDKMELVSGAIAEKFAMGMGGRQNYGFRMDLNNRIWTKGDTAGFALSYASNFIPLLSLGSLVADGIAGQMRDTESRKNAPDVIRQIAAQLPGLHVSVGKAVNSTYQEMGDKAKKLIQDHFAGQMEQAEHRVNQTAAVAGKAQEEKDTIRQAIGRARELFQGLQNI